MDVNTVIDNLCERFGVAAEYLIPKVSQYLIVREGIALAITSSFIVLFTVVVIFLLRKGSKDDWTDMITGSLIIAAICLVSAILFCIPTIYTFLVYKLSPEMSAIDYILKMVK